MRRIRTLAACLAIIGAACASHPLKKDSTPVVLRGHDRQETLWDPVSVCGLVLLKTESTVGSGAGAPYEMVVLGDSILWGQGLAEEQKASTLVQQWIRDRTDRPVRKQVFAHSGAPVLQDSRGFALMPGEVPASFPPVTLQAECVPHPETVDLVLVNGCINDVDATSIMDPTIDPTTNRIDDLGRGKCGEPMRQLLERIAARFPRARIVVTGYYPFVSPKTPKRSFRFLTYLFVLLFRQDKALPSFSAIPSRLIRNSEQWYKSSNESLEWAANRVGTEGGEKGRVVFAPLPFAPENAYGARKSFLWGVFDNDPVAPDRLWQCLRQSSIIGRLRCINASAFHLNPKGAKAAAKAIERAIEHAPEPQTASGAARN